MTSFAPRGYAAVTIRPPTIVDQTISPMARAQAAAQARRHAEAAQWFEKALEEKPEDAQARVGLGQSLCQLGRRNEGTAQVRQAGPHFVDAARQSGDVGQLLFLISQLQQWSDFSGALELALQAVQINSGDFRVHQLLAVTYSQLNNTAEALLASRRALELNPENNMMHILQASLEAD
ncbi:tetratricopeptide repeat protein, partial [Rhodoferax sp.]|uniref:tetratricopeptide repeat protein n=1 Tax=Rhodoferax sp. TaxID=50421 RepID=UPI0027275B9D